jgi:phage-related protein
MSFASTYFLYDNEQNIDYGVYLVHLETGFYPSPASGSKNIISEKNPFRDTPYFYRTELDLMKFSITLAPLDGTWIETTKFNLFKWLGNRTYKAFQSSDDLSKMCYCICTNPKEIYSVGINGQFYLTLEFVASSPYWFSMPEISTYDLSDIGSTPTTITMENRSNVPNVYGEYCYYPEVWVDLKSTCTGFSFTNLSNGGLQHGFSGLTALESLYINNDKKQIISSISETTYRLNKMLYSYQWFKLIYGVNQIQVTLNSGGIVIQTRMQYPLYL